MPHDVILAAVPEWHTMALSCTTPIGQQACLALSARIWMLILVPIKGPYACRFGSECGAGPSGRQLGMLAGVHEFVRRTRGR